MAARRKKTRRTSIKEVPIIDPSIKKKKRNRRIIFASIFAVIFVSLMAFYFLQDRDQQVIVTEVVSFDDLIQTVEVTGEVESENEVALSFNSSGIVAEVLVETGDFVEEGQIIARLDNDELQANVDQATQSVQSAQANLALQQAGATSEEILVALAAVETAEASLVSAQTQRDNAIINGDAAIEKAALARDAAEDDYQSTLVNNAQSIEDAKASLISSMKSSLIDIRAAISEVDLILGIDNSLANDDFESILSHENPSLVTQAEQLYTEAKLNRDVAEGVVFSLSTADSIDVIDDGAEEIEAAFGSVQELLLKTANALDATSLETPTFSLSDLEVLKANIETQRNAVQIEESAFVSSRNALASAQVSAATSEVDALNAISEAERAYNQSVKDKSASIASAESNITIKEAEVSRAEASLAQLEADPRYVDLATYIAEVDRAKAQLSAAKAQLDGASIVAPISGNVTGVSVDVGEQIAVGVPAIDIQTTQELFKITVDIPEADIFKVEEDDIVEVTFDAFGDDVIFAGHVSIIDPAEKNIEGVVFYHAEVLLEEEPAGLRPGMSTDVVIITEELSDILTVPQRAVLEVEGRKIVRVLKDGKDYEEREVTVGIRGDEGRVQILDGLSAGDEIIVSIRD